MNDMPFDIGIMTFGEVTEDPTTGTPPSPRQRVRETIELAKVGADHSARSSGRGHPEH